jgi:hypothetical protein
MPQLHRPEGEVHRRARLSSRSYDQGGEVRTLFLHIGHGKTGSSWIQSSLRLSRAALAVQGIDYPSRRDSGVGDPTRITSGNGIGLLTSAEGFDARIAGCQTPPERSLFFSSEFLFREIEDSESVGFLRPVAHKHGFERVSLLLFIRDPLGHAASEWQQSVKRGGAVESVGDFFAHFAMPEGVAAVLDRLERAGVELAVRNYSRCRDRLLAETAGWLGIGEATLTPPPAARVNRSLTRSEIALQQALNSRLGRCGELLSDPLCERLPDLEPDDVRPPVAVQEAAWNRLLPAIERVNARLPEEHRYRCDIREPAPETESLCFSAAQLDVIAGAVAGEIARLRSRAATSVEIMGVRGLARALARRTAAAIRRRLAGGRRPGDARRTEGFG